MNNAEPLFFGFCFAVVNARKEFFLAHAELIKRDKFAFIHICHLALLENEILGSTNAIRISPKIIESIESVE